MTIPEDEDHLQLRFTVPEAEKTRYGLMTRDLVVMVRLETRQPDNAYQPRDYLLRLAPDSAFPVTPSDESPGDDPLWCQLQADGSQPIWMGSRRVRRKRQQRLLALWIQLGTSIPLKQFLRRLNA
ncbi:hypothetical protein EZI54_21485 [Marinobacter halodurans]|uniref:Uncharacterized protein n=2 Tax=Marinobacter halodurans TaxID=2528979 RepID=A0ABY1ZGW4_9GAMM|nr:hypothetical protein EZI54_21485 [Marinobacter halodurans]